jgi:ribonuclease E
LALIREHFSVNEEAIVSIFPTVDVLFAELLEEQVVPMILCENAGQPDDVPVVVGYADEDEEDEDEEEDLDDLDDDEDEEEDDEDLDFDWEEVGDEDDDEEDKEEGEDKEDE